MIFVQTFYETGGLQSELKTNFKRQLCLLSSTQVRICKLMRTLSLTHTQRQIIMYKVAQHVL